MAITEEMSLSFLCKSFCGEWSHWRLNIRPRANVHFLHCSNISEIVQYSPKSTSVVKMQTRPRLGFANKSYQCTISLYSAFPLPVGGSDGSSFDCSVLTAHQQLGFPSEWSSTERRQTMAVNEANPHLEDELWLRRRIHFFKMESDQWLHSMENALNAIRIHIKISLSSKSYCMCLLLPSNKKRKDEVWHLGFDLQEKYPPVVIRQEEIPKVEHLWSRWFNSCVPLLTTPPKGMCNQYVAVGLCCLPLATNHGVMEECRTVEGMIWGLGQPWSWTSDQLLTNGVICRLFAPFSMQFSTVRFLFVCLFSF